MAAATALNTEKRVGIVIPALSKPFAREVAAGMPTAVTVHSDTDAFAHRVAELLPEVPLQRAGSADEVAQAIAWLLSDAASYMTASLIDVTGGR